MSDTTLGFLAASAALKYYIFTRWYDRRPRQATVVGRVSTLNFFPVKSAGNIVLEEATCTDHGMVTQGTNDR